jgi:hypothetical protein
MNVSHACIVDDIGEYQEILGVVDTKVEKLLECFE